MSGPFRDGGPAFPSEPRKMMVTADNSVSFVGFNGMSLRDWFAGQALAAYGAPFNEDETRIYVARRCYEMADAMLKARDNSDA